MTATVTTLSGIDVLGDGYELVYVNDKCLSRGDGNYEYTTGAADALVGYLDADEQYVTLEISDEFAETPEGEDYAVQNFWQDVEDSSLESVLTAAKEYGLTVKIEKKP